MKRADWARTAINAIKDVALVAAICGAAIAYFVAASRYECFAPGSGPMADGSGRWFYMCAGPEPRPSQRVSLGEALRRFGMP